MAKQTYDDFKHTTKVPATSILAPQSYLDAIGRALAEYARARERATRASCCTRWTTTPTSCCESCWPKPAIGCH